MSAGMIWVCVGVALIPWLSTPAASVRAAGDVGIISCGAGAIGMIIVTGLAMLGLVGKAAALDLLWAPAALAGSGALLLGVAVYRAR